MLQSRQLAAIMFADIVGYTAMMQHDETSALTILHHFKNELNLQVKEFGGEIINYYGDGCLITFTNSTNAVSCAKILQEELRKDPYVPIRIGIHLGEILVEEGNVFGDSVNISSRIESMGVPGVVLLSDTIQKQIKNKPRFQLTSLGSFEFKNLDEPMEIFALSNPGFPVPNRADLIGKFKEAKTTTPAETLQTVKITSEKSIAVLPFVNMSNDPEQEYFSDGMVEEIINSLANIKELRVAGRTSSFHFKGKNIDLRIIGEKLNVKTILEGSIRKQVNKLRITAQLVNVENGFHLWSEKYDRDMNDIFAIQDEIALAITEKLKITLLEDERAVIHKNPTENKEAYDLYLKGRYYFNKRGPGIKTGFKYFQQAADKDPSFVLAYSGMADSYMLLGFYSIIPPHIAMPKAKQFAEKAIQLDASHAEAVTTLAFINTFYDWDWMEAKKKFQLSFELNPNYADAYYWYSYYLSFVENKFEEGIKFARKAAEQLEPLVSISHIFLSIVLINAGKFEEARQAAKMAIELNADSFPGYRSLGISLAALKKYEEAIEALEISVKLSTRHPWILSELSYTYSLSGQVAESQKLMDELVMRSKTEFIPGLSLAVTAYSIKDYDKTAEFLELAFDQRDGSIISMNGGLMSSFVKTDPRFQAFFKRMNFPE